MSTGEMGLSFHFLRLFARSHGKSEQPSHRWHLPTPTVTRHGGVTFSCWHGIVSPFHVLYRQSEMTIECGI